MYKYSQWIRQLPLLVFLLAVSVCGCFATGPQPLYFSPQGLLPHTDRNMKTAGFWISRQSDPDRVVLNEKDIERLNVLIQDELKLTQDIFKIPAVYPGDQLRAEIEKQFNFFVSRSFFDAQGNLLRSREVSVKKEDLGGKGSAGAAGIGGKIDFGDHLNDFPSLRKPYDFLKGKSSPSAPASSSSFSPVISSSPPLSSSPFPPFYRDIRRNLHLHEILSAIPTRHGLIVRYSDQRLLPTALGLYEKKFDIDFDEVQNSSLDVGTPVAILHQSLDGNWLYAVSHSSTGWVWAQNIALCSLEQLNEFLNPQTFIVVTRAKADIFWDESLTRFNDYARMGYVFPVREKFNPDIYIVTVPLRSSDGTVNFQKGYLRAVDVHEGFLPYTQRTMITQAFELLNAPYGWGGMYGEQDCSAFLQEIFATVGIFLPRNSKEQSQVGDLAAEFKQDSSLGEKESVLKTKALDGITILGLKGHIMLFLGEIDDRYYAIHAAWGYREPSLGGRDRVRVLNRVIVSDLSLGEGSRKGSLLKRLLSVRMIK